MNEMLYVWIGALVLFLVLEGATAGITSLWFVVGSLAALIIALLQWPEWFQIGVFLTVSLTSLFLLRPLVKKFIEPKKAKTNIEAKITPTPRDALSIQDENKSRILFVKIVV